MEWNYYYHHEDFLIHMHMLPMKDLFLESHSFLSFSHDRVIPVCSIQLTVCAHLKLSVQQMAARHPSVLAHSVFVILCRPEKTVSSSSNCQSVICSFKLGGTTLHCDFKMPNQCETFHCGWICTVCDCSTAWGYKAGRQAGGRGEWYSGDILYKYTVGVLLQCQYHSLVLSPSFLGAKVELPLCNVQREYLWIWKKRCNSWGI